MTAPPSSPFAISRHTDRQSDHGRAPVGLHAVEAPAAPTLQIDVTTDHDRTRVCPAGDVDLATAGMLEQRVLDLLRDGAAWVVVDLRGVTFIDSSGIHALVNAHHQARESGQSISVVPGRPANRRTLELAGVADYLQLDAEDSATTA